MKTLSLVVFILVIAACLDVQANPVPNEPIFGLYADSLGTVGDVFDTGPGLLNIHVVAKVVNPDPDWHITSVWLTLMPPPCFDGVHVGDTSIYTVTGNSHSLAIVDFGGCLSGTIHVMTVTYSVQGTTSECCWYDAIPYLEIWRCTGSPIYLPPELIDGVWINPNAEHNCIAPIEETTWGGIKAMYN